MMDTGICVENAKGLCLFLQSERSPICAMPGCNGCATTSTFCRRHRPHPDAVGFTTSTVKLSYPELYPCLLLDTDIMFTKAQCTCLPAYDDECFDPSSHKYIEGLRVRYIDLENRGECFIVFVSHRWLSPSKAGDGHPDRPEDGHPKFHMLRNAIAKMKEGKLRGMRVLLWIDFCCLEQDNGIEVPCCLSLLISDWLLLFCCLQVMRGIDSLPSYIERSDALLTPVVEAKGEPKWWNSETFGGYGIKNLFEEYGSKAWGIYKSRGWCRVSLSDHVLSAIDSPDSRGGCRSRYSSRATCRCTRIVTATSTSATQ